MKFLQSIWMTILVGVVVFTGSLFLMWRQMPQPGPVAQTPSADEPKDKSFVFTSNPEIELLIKELQERQAALDQREVQLRELEARLKADREEIAGIQRAAENMLGEVTNRIVTLGPIEAENLKRLAKIYASLTPENAATVFNKYDDAGVAKLLAFMKEDEAALVLGAISAGGPDGVKRVAAITELLRVTERQPTTAKAP